MIDRHTDELEKRCELQLETIRELRAELARAQSTLKSWQSGNEKAGLAQAKAENKELRVQRDDFKALCRKLNDTGNAVSDELAHAIEVKNRCVATVNRLCSQVVELQAQLKGKE